MYYVIVVQGEDPERLRYEVEGIQEFVAVGDSDVDTYTTGPFDGDGPKQVDHAFGLLDTRVQEYGWEYDEHGTPLDSDKMDLAREDRARCAMCGVVRDITALDDAMCCEKCGVA